MFHQGPWCLRSQERKKKKEKEKKKVQIFLPGIKGRKCKIPRQGPRGDTVSPLVNSSWRVFRPSY